ncbi:MAG: hypothetical protein HPY66_3395 [Firmicutes bacterium]|nr:hypothetical protein [Bacillota bacterium]
MFCLIYPYIFLFYLVFGFIEDLGYLPRVAIILDRLLHKIGLHGYSVIPNVLGGIFIINLFACFRCYSLDRQVVFPRG